MKYHKTTKILSYILAIGFGVFVGLFLDFKDYKKPNQRNNELEIANTSKSPVPIDYTKVFVMYMFSAYEAITDLESTLDKYPTITDTDTKIADYAVMRLGIALEKLSEVAPPSGKVEQHTKAISAINNARLSAIGVFLDTISVVDGLQTFSQSKQTIELISKEFKLDTEKEY